MPKGILLYEKIYVFEEVGWQRVCGDDDSWEEINVGVNGR
jgi:hypothetical protein